MMQVQTPYSVWITKMGRSSYDWPPKAAGDFRQLAEAYMGVLLERTESWDLMHDLTIQRCCSLVDTFRLKAQDLEAQEEQLAAIGRQLNA